MNRQVSEIALWILPTDTLSFSPAYIIFVNGINIIIHLVTQIINLKFISLLLLQFTPPGSVHLMSRVSFFLQVVTATLLAQGLGPLSLVPSAVPSSFQSNLYTVVKIILLNLRNDHVISPPQKPFMTAPAYTIESKLVNMIEDPVSGSKLPSPPPLASFTLTHLCSRYTKCVHVLRMCPPLMLLNCFRNLPLFLFHPPFPPIGFV